jgi:hypothetical protein
VSFVPLEIRRHAIGNFRQLIGLITGVRNN